MHPLDLISPVLLFLCTEQIMAVPHPLPFMSIFLQSPPPVRSKRPPHPPYYPHHHQHPHGHTPNNHDPVTSPGQVITSSFTEGRKVPGGIEEVEEFHPTQNQNDRRPPAGFSHISEVSHPKSSYSHYDTSEHRHPDRDHNPSNAHGESYQGEDNDEDFEYGSDNDENDNNAPKNKGLYKLFLLTPHDVTDQFQIVLIKRPKDNRVPHGHSHAHKPIYQSTRHYPQVQHNYPLDHSHTKENSRRQPPVKAPYNYFDQLKQGQPSKYVSGTYHYPKENSMKLDFDSTNYGYAPSMLYKNYETSKAYSTPDNSTEISPSTYAPNMNYGYYGVGGVYNNATKFNIPK